MSRVKPPAPRPCGSCPYRRDAPSGVWSAEEYEKLPLYDGPTGEQAMSVFMCHQQDGCLCAGWVGTHDMEENLALRLAVASDAITVEDFHAVCDYETDVPLFESGAVAAEHGMARIEEPGEDAIRVVTKLAGKRGRRVA